MLVFLLKSKDKVRDSIIWNMIGSMLNAFQSVIFLMILTRTVGIVEAGIFTIAFANANLFLNVGKYGVRNYQVSDVKNQFNFKEYLLSRWITTFLMMIISIVYTFFIAYMNQYSLEKIWIIIWMCLFKAVDSIEDVYIGEYQKKGRLDVGAKIMALRMILTIIIFGIVVIVTSSLLSTLIISTCFTIIVEFSFIKNTYPKFREKKEVIRKGKFRQLLITCFPVAISSFLSFYICNAAKYAIDAQLSDEVQACYGFISMPVFVIGLLNGFIFVPIIYRLSVIWEERRIKDFIKQIAIQTLMIMFTTIICLIGAYVLGIPVLSLLYNTDLSIYKREMLILLIGGGFLGWSGILNTILTIMRRQEAMMICYCIVSLLALSLSSDMVKKYDITGAAILYTGLVMILSISFLIIIIREIKFVCKK